MSPRTIKQLPPHLTALLNRLSETGKVFIELYECRKERMHMIASELRQISEEVTEMQAGTNTTRVMGVVLGGLGIVLGVPAAVLAVSAAGERAVILPTLGCTAALVVGGANVITANVKKAVTEKICIDTVEKLGREFMTIVEQQKEVLEEIREVSEELEEKSSSITTTAGAQTRRILWETEQLQQFLEQTAELAEKSREVMDVTLNMLRRVSDLVKFVISITRITPASELKDCITASALQCEKTLNEFANMRNMLKDFEDMQTQ